MSIFIDETTPIVVQGITGKEGAFWTGHMIDLGARVVAGVTPGKEGQEVRGIPVYHSVARAQEANRAEAAMLFVPPRFTRDAVYEALNGGIKKIITIADGIPLRDQVEIRAAARSEGAQVVGGNTSGVISPGRSMAGTFPYWIKRVYKPGRIGVMTRSGSLTNEVTSMIVAEGFGVSTLIGVGGDPVPGTRFAEFLDAFQHDSETEGVVIVGELGGTMEEEVARAMADQRFTKPLVAFIGGRTAPRGKRMGHAGAIVTGSAGTVAAKDQALTRAGALVADRPSTVGTMLRSLLPEAR
ncbi:succinyl-CoA synthetase (ADP-forming) alpha subunit [Alkalispirochaeta americana]|uniref:Succinyl-CoA synthetase (ADP-forming) alpha subunit n=1 Tax=Alkalispirochaeta americana TaxID=159291 RepID=A0A1N6VDW3_9SPIO|nr:CoA-binding protein [Alkalispirochaeta americana]SIQ76100.1 succinyl-CoA synthetase (ADP-forming) alpha subunit [Alkalispirochaeta americana]